MVFVNLTASIDKAGRIVIPKAMRDDLGLQPGDELHLELDGDSIIARPAQQHGRMTKELGIWVFHGSRKITQAESRALMQQQREERDRHFDSEPQIANAK